MKIALDVDDVLAAFTPHAHAFHKVPMDEKVDYWCERTMDTRLGQQWFFKHIAPVEEFWKTLPILSKPEDITFDFDCYMSSFPIEMYQLRVDWLRQHGFPDKPLIVTQDKLTTCLELGINVLIDDKPQTMNLLIGTEVRGIHFINKYAGFEPVGEYVTNLNQVNNLI